MAENRGVAYVGQGKVEMQSIPFPKLEGPRRRKIEHGVIQKVISINIFGSDQHMVHGRTAASTVLVLALEITGVCLKSARKSKRSKRVI